MRRHTERGEEDKEEELEEGDIKKGDTFKQQQKHYPICCSKEKEHSEQEGTRWLPL